MKFTSRILALAALAWGHLSAAPVRNGAVTAELVSAVAAVQPGRSFTVALRLEHQPHWHTYWVNAGTGYPTSLTWTLPPGWIAGDIQWPVPHLIQDAQGKVTGHGYDGVVFLHVTLTPPASAPAGPVTLKAKAEWLMCEEMCVPGEANLELTVPVSAETPQPNPTWAGTIAEATQHLPIELPPGWSATATREPKAVTLALTLESAIELKAPHFFSADGFIAYEGTQRVDSKGARLTLTLPISPDADPKTAVLDGVLAFTNAQGDYDGLKLHLPFSSQPQPPVKTTKSVTLPALTPATATGGAAVGTGLWATLGLAVLGGLVLNLMPCVFPVLSIKILGFVNQSGHDRRRITLHGLVFSSGVLVSFWVLAGLLAVLRASGDQLGWGFQLQSPAFVFALAVVMLVFALSLSGVFEFGLRATGVGARLQMRDGYGGSFFTGVLATVVATPCSAPFLAPALGAALALPVVQSFFVFTAIAIGLALPYLLLSIFPQAVRVLPKPGAWMETFKQFMAFPLYATVGYLLWVLAGQTAESGLLMAFFGLTLVAMAAWFYGRFGLWSGRKALAALVLLVYGGWLGWPQAASPSDITWEPWSPEAITKANAAGKTVYVDFTARWCATCQANKKLVFGNDEVKRTFRARGIVMLKADWTNRDPRITAELAKWGRSAVPFNLVVKPGQLPQPLPELLSPGLVLEAVQKR